jgi:23S rRNA (cytosine1962-C5)-methyltransferase
MKKEMEMIIKSRYINKIRAGNPLINKEMVFSDTTYKEGSIIKLVDNKNKFLAKGYYGIQNKGCGWILSKKENENIDIPFFEKKIIVALNKRKKYHNDPKTNAYRVFNGEGDGIGGFTIDYFDGYYLINWYSKGIYKFRDHVVNFLKKIDDCKAIYHKKRFDTFGKYIEEDGFILGTRAEFPIIVKENNVNFAIYLNEGAMVGIFLDQREVRKLIRDKYSEGKTVLNTFSYTGAFSVYSALGNAKKTTSVDLANRSLEKTIEQFSMNEIDYTKHEIIVEDVFNYFKFAAKKNLKYDLVILDPPSYAKSKKFKFSASRDYKSLLKETILITENNGIIVASTNCSTFDMKKFKKFIDDAFKEMNKRYQLLEEFTLPDDFKTIKEFKQGNYLKVVFIKKLK